MYIYFQMTLTYLLTANKLFHTPIRTFVNLCNPHFTLNCHFKGALCRFEGEIQTQNFNIYNIHEVMVQTQKYLL